MKSEFENCTFTDKPKPKVGDVVHVRATVTAIGTVGVTVVPRDYVAFSDIVHVEPRPLKAGDRVMLRAGSGFVGTVIGIHDNRAWTICAGHYETYPLIELVRADA